MADREYKWNREFLEACRRRLKRENNNLERQRSAVDNLKADVAANWQSFSSEIYLESLEVDVENLNAIIQAVDEMNGLLKEVIDQAYGECEDKVRTDLSQVSSSLHRL